MVAILANLTKIHVAVAVVFAALSYREFSWQQHCNALAEQLERSKEETATLTYRLEIEESACELGSEDSMARLAQAFKAKLRTTQPLYFYFSADTLIQTLALASMMWYERFSVHCDVAIGRLAGAGGEQGILKELDGFVKQFVLRRAPMVTFLGFLFIFWCSILAWFGLFVDRSSFVTTCLRMLLCYAHALPLNLIFCNTMQLFNGNYLPSSSPEWRRSLQDVHWWVWFVSRLFGVHDMMVRNSTILRIVLD